MWLDFALSILSGLVGSALTGILLIVREQRRWSRTKTLFLSKLSGEAHLAGYEILRVLDVDNFKDGGDSFKPDEEVIEEVLDADVSASQFIELDRIFRKQIDKLEIVRAQALAIPTFTSEDFHESDGTLNVLKAYTSAHYFYSPLEHDDSETPKLKQSLKQKLVDIYKYPSLRMAGHKLTLKQKRLRKKFGLPLKKPK